MSKQKQKNTSTSSEGIKLVYEITRSLKKPSLAPLLVIIKGQLLLMTGKLENIFKRALQIFCPLPHTQEILKVPILHD